MHRQLHRSVSFHDIVRLAGLLSLVCLVGCESQPADQPEAEAETQTSAMEAAVADDRPSDPLAYPVPDGDALELIKFISDVVSQEPRGETDQERTIDVGRQMDARIRAAERLAKIAETEDQMLVAKRSKLESLRVLGMIGRESARDDFSKFAGTLATDESNQIAKVGRLGKYQNKLDEFLTDGSGDPSGVLGELGTLLENEQADRALFDVANETGMVLQQVGLPDQAGSVFAMIASKFADNEDEQIAKAAKNALIKSQMAKVAAAYRSTFSGEAGPDALVKAAEQATSGDNVPTAMVMQLLNLTQNLEYSGKVDVASKLYEAMQDAANRLEDPSAKQQVQDMAEAGLNRVKIVGGPFEIVGQTAAGEEFSWPDYEGKVVLVDFWATWCRPCLAELPNVRENYNRYHDRGFEVVGVNIDDDREQLKAFLERNELPWVTVVSEEGQPIGYSDPNATRYNVEAIPFLVLVGRDGNVDALHLRGELLSTRLAELFPETNGDTESNESASAEAAGAEAESSGDIEMDVAEAEKKELEPTTNVELEDTETLPPDEPPLDQPLLETNPYLADPELSATDLMLYLLELADKPKSVQARPGFRDAVVDAADRVLSESTNDKHRKIAAQKKLDFWHRDARVGDDAAQRQLMVFIEQLESEMPEALDDEIRFFRLEQNALDTAAADVALIDSSCEYLETQGESLDQRHLRLASSTVEMINALPGEEREPYFQRLATALSASKTRDVARYGKRLAGKPASGKQLIGKELALTGITVDGNAFDIKHYREQVVVVDFWATWCGPCRKAHPVLVELEEKHEGLMIVGVSLDADEEALDDYLQTKETAGVTLFGKEAQQAAEDLGITGIPTFLVVDPAGKIQAVTNNPQDLDAQITGLLESQLAEN